MTEEDRAALDAELAARNAEVKTAIAKRKAWMDSHMADYARYQVGETIYDMRSKQLLGVVSKLYRYWGDDRDPTYDTSMDIEYEFKIPQGSYDNTSRHAGALWIGNEAERIAHLESELRMAKLREGGPEAALDWAAIFASDAKKDHQP